MKKGTCIFVVAFPVIFITAFRVKNSTFNIEDEISKHLKIKYFNHTEKTQVNETPLPVSLTTQSTTTATSSLKPTKDLIFRANTHEDKGSKEDTRVTQGILEEKNTPKDTEPLGEIPNIRNNSNAKITIDNVVNRGVFDEVKENLKNQIDKEALRERPIIKNDYHRTRRYGERRKRPIYKLQQEQDPTPEPTPDPDPDEPSVTTGDPDPDEPSVTKGPSDVDDGKKYYTPPEFLNPYALLYQLDTLKCTSLRQINVTTEVLGKTEEFNSIVLMKLSERNELQFRAMDDSKYIDDNTTKSIIFIVHGLSVLGMKHVKPLVEVKYFKMLIEYYAEYVDLFDIFLIPLGNPDGTAEVIFHTEDIGFTASKWDKNLSPQQECRGVNLDRNLDVAWNSSRILSSCSHLYPGATPFSEPETQAVRDVFHRFGQRIVGYIHVHASSVSSLVKKGDAILYPKGYTDAADDDDRYMDLKAEIDEMLRNESFQSVNVAMDTLYNWYGEVSGTSVDYASTIYGTQYAMELAMQSYADELLTEIDELHLTELWQRVLKVIFEHIYQHKRKGRYEDSK